ncbi:hypothetical protein A7K91_12530 [Paenibacillus oryzae]|uniref:Acyltransferase 3 domain-containing protein n=1 Tax=Paenibacillus oryzae TaxID=1844972 RepID=A0A1A5YG07_9BACL|nr:acyltransferase [Paenibacillus oryzae]OBR64335.1 hypothetical protein A7K91_12530 [Paenibacillus oryzae]
MKRYESIQILRGLAALSVLLYHFAIYSERIGMSSKFSFFSNSFFSYGALLFFVISGFVMAMLIDNCQPNFLLNRFLRIYPSYWLAIVLCIFIKVLVFEGVAEKNLLQAMTLLPWGEIQYPLGIEWTLVFEVFFYMLCAIFANKFFKKYFIYFLILWGIAIIVSNVQTNLLTQVYLMPFSKYNLFFISGCLSFYIHRRINFAPRTSLVLIIVCSTITLLVHLYVYDNNLKYPLLAILFSIAVLFSTKIKLKKNNKLLIKLGDYSYGIYLSHVVVATTLMAYLQLIVGDELSVPLLLVILTLTLVCCWYYGKIDLFLYKSLRKIPFKK